MAKGKCINIGKPCNLAISEEIQDADPANFVCKECGKPLVAVEGGDGPTVPTKPLKKGLIIGICIAAVAAGGLFWYFNQNKDNKTKGPDTGVVVDPVKTTGATTATGTDTTDTNTIAITPVPNTSNEPETVPQTEPQTNPNYLNSYALPYGIYEGPAQDGVPHGLNGEVRVTKAYQLDLKAGGEMLDLNPGDVIISCKFRNGKIVQGFLKRKNGQAKDFNIGI